MLKIVLKYPFDFDRLPYLQTLDLPAGAQFLSAQLQHNQLVVWVLVDTNQPEQESRSLLLFGTGQLIGYEVIAHLDTVLMHDGDLVVHVFEVHLGTEQRD